MQCSAPAPQGPPPASGSVLPAGPVDPAILRPVTTDAYRLGAGDVLEVLAPRLPEVAGEYRLDLTGRMTVHPIGDIDLDGKNRSQAESHLRERLQPFFRNPALTLRIKSYEKNRVYVFGRVQKPGVISFHSQGRLLEVLARAGMPAANARGRNVRRCSILRDNRTLIWLDLSELLERGNLTLNLPLAAGDVVFVPEPAEEFVFVLGEVKSPGSYPLRGQERLLEAVARAGGRTENGKSEVRLIRRDARGRGRVYTVDLNDFLKGGDARTNFRLRPDDVIYVPRRGIARINYYLRMINPFAQVFYVGKTASDAFRATEDTQ